MALWHCWREYSFGLAQEAMKQSRFGMKRIAGLPHYIASGTQFDRAPKHLGARHRAQVPQGAFGP
jgi:hypothetical protein